MSIKDFATSSLLGAQGKEQLDGQGNPWIYEDKDYTVNGIPSPLHFYYISDNILKLKEFTTHDGQTVTSLDNENIAANGRRFSLPPMMQSTGILSVLYVPFMPETSLKLNRYNYDQDYYGTVSEKGYDTELRRKNCFVYKIMGWDSGALSYDVKLKTLRKYPTELFKKGGGKRHWSNESKLFQYPYYYATLNDYMNAPLQIRMDLIDGNDNDKKRPDFDVKVRQALSINGTYTLYVPYLKGDADGTEEGMKSLSPLDLPTSSSQYAQFMANNKSSYNVQNAMAIGNALLGNNGRIASANTTIGQGMADIQNHKYWDESDRSGWGGAPAYKVDKKMLSGGKIKVKSGVFDIANELGSRVVNTAGTVAGMYAKRSDMMSAPRNVSLQGGDVMDAITNGKRRVDIIRYHIQEEYLQKIGDYFAMYGYKQNKFMKIDLRSRKNYNYIKTVGANIQSKGAIGIPKKHINALKAIFDKGITLWHMDRNDGFMNYDNDNKEV